MNWQREVDFSEEDSAQDTEATASEVEELKVGKRVFGSKWQYLKRLYY
jgi:hypothetical protein